MSPERASTAGHSPLPRGRYPGADAPRGWARKIRRVLGLRRSFNVDGIRYKEVTTEPLRYALSRRGSGSKDYEVQFRNGNRMRITCTPDRLFADLIPPLALPVFLRTERLLRPGMRVAVLPCGSGFVAASVSGRVAPSGAVVALDQDQSLIDFARQRYPIQNISFECGGLDHLCGETDGASDAVISTGPHASSSEQARISELWRLIAPGGWLLIASSVPQVNTSLAARNEPRPEAAELMVAMAQVCAPRDLASDGARSLANLGLLGDGVDGWIVVIARRDDQG